MPIIGAIKEGVKTKVAAKLPNLFPASRTTYDNTSSGLSANRVQGAIDEVNGKVDRGSVSVTTTGTQTYADILNALYTAADLTKVTDNAYIKLANSIIFRKTRNYQFITMNVSSTALSMDKLTLASNASTYLSATPSGVTDVSTQVVAANINFELFY